MEEYWLAKVNIYAYIIYKARMNAHAHTQLSIFALQKVVFSTTASNGDACIPVSLVSPTLRVPVALHANQLIFTAQNS